MLSLVFSNVFNTVTEAIAEAAATHQKNNYINSLAESCRHRVKLFAIFLNLHIPAAIYGIVIYSNGECTMHTLHYTWKALKFTSPPLGFSASFHSSLSLTLSSSTIVICSLHPHTRTIYNWHLTTFQTIAIENAQMRQQMCSNRKIVDNIENSQSYIKYIHMDILKQIDKLLYKLYTACSWYTNQRIKKENLRRS